MHTVALTFIRSSAVADEVAQEARRGALRSLDRFEGSPRQQRPYAPEPYRSATGQTPASKNPSASARRARGVLRRTDGSLPHEAMAFGFAVETRDPLARNQFDLLVKHGIRQPLLGSATDCRGRQALGNDA